MKKILIAMVIVLAMVQFSDSANARRISLNAIYLTPFGPVRFIQKGKNITGKLLRPSGTCPFLKGDKIFDGVLVEDNLTGKLRVCREGNGCSAEAWAFTVAVIANGGKKISGSAYAGGKNCSVPGLLAGKGVLFFRHKIIKPKRRRAIAKRNKKRNTKQNTQAINTQQQKTDSKEEPNNDEDIIGPLPEPGTYNPLMASAHTELKLSQKQKIENLLRKAEAYMRAGRAIPARKLFKQALKIDKNNASALGGIGVTYYLLKDYKNALKYYRKAVAVDPNYGDGYYNIACIYALKGKKELALKYLKISVMQGFRDISIANQDPDLASLHSLPQFKELLNKYTK